MKDPFLFRYLNNCLSPARVLPSAYAGYEYDESVDLVRWLGAENRPLAIEISGVNGPPTKKRDQEKGDDNKDRRMWQ